MPRLGVVGTMVWDTIHARDVGRETPVQEWGGIAYALAGVDAGLPEGWSMFPIIKVGRDMRRAADEFFGSLERIDSLDGVRTVPEPNNRVELFYQDAGRRCEKLTGGVPGWSLEEILCLAPSCDAVYVNFIAGWELDLPAARSLRAVVPGPLYCDLHSLMLGVGPDGVRELRALPDWRSWLSSFDMVQLNEDELATLAEGRDDPWTLAADVVGADTKGLLVTLGGRGAAWVATREFWRAPLGSWPAPFASRPVSLAAPPSAGRVAAAPEPLLSGKVDAARVVEGGDPTGCGDVWGATCFTSLLAGADLEAAMRAANAAAARNASFRGASGLAEHLRSASGLITGARPRRRGGAG